MGCRLERRSLEPLKFSTMYIPRAALGSSIVQYLKDCNFQVSAINSSAGRATSFIAVVLAFRISTRGERHFAVASTRNTRPSVVVGLIIPPSPLSY